MLLGQILGQNYTQPLAANRATYNPPAVPVFTSNASLKKNPSTTSSPDSGLGPDSHEPLTIHHVADRTENAQQFTSIVPSKVPNTRTTSENIMTEAKHSIENNRCGAERLDLNHSWSSVGTYGVSENSTTTKSNG